MAARQYRTERLYLTFGYAECRKAWKIHNNSAERAAEYYVEHNVIH